MPLATGVQTLTCIERLDMLAHGFEFGGVGGGCGWFALHDIAPLVANMSRGAHYFLYRLCTQIPRVTVLICYKHHHGFNLCKHVCLSKVL